MDFASSTFWASLLQIIWIDLLLSGDTPARIQSVDYTPIAP